MDVRLSRIRDRFGDFIGYLFIAWEVHHLRELTRRFNITPRELAVIEYILSGNSNREIAEILAVSERTVKTHITNIYTKLFVENKVQLLNALKTYSESAGKRHTSKGGTPA